MKTVRSNKDHPSHHGKDGRRKGPKLPRRGGSSTVQSIYRFEDLVDMKSFSRMLESFFQATGIPNGVVDVSGELLSLSAGENACTRFHRACPKTEALCRESNIAIMHDLRDGHVAGGICRNGLMDYATPVVIDGRQLATLFLGQVLHEPPDLEFFRAQAAAQGFDEKSYLESIQAIPVIEKERLQSFMKFMVEMARTMAASGLARLRETELKRDISLHVERQIQLEDILDFSPVAIGWSDQQGRIEYVNDQFTRLFGYTLDDVPDVQAWYQRAYPDVRYRETVVSPWMQAVDLARANGTHAPDLESSITCRNGEVRRAIVSASWVGPRRLVNFSDITDRWLNEQHKQAHDALLEMIARGAPLDSILNAIVRQIEAEDKTALCSILLLDEQGKHLLSGAAPSLPAFYNEAIHGVEIGKGVGSCGTAAFLGQRVIVEDIQSHEYWIPYRQLARQANLGSCWSEPIMSSRGKVLGTFAIYHASPKSPLPADIERIGIASSLASIAIESRLAYEELEHRAYFDYLTGLANRRNFLERAESELASAKRFKREMSIMMLDIDHFKRVNDSYGHHVGDVALKKLAEICLLTLRNVDLVGRIGGEEFAILMRETGPEQALEIAERLRAAVASTPIILEKGEQLQLTVSLGVTALGDKNTNIDLLLNQADQALYRSKNEGRNRVTMYSA
jgi:diguanylate cyclase (GGDEF)-like protein/PAS domain S-box-containing protein